VFAGPPNENEERLYLNVFTPKHRKQKKLPVLVWIYGSGHVDGDSNDYGGSKLTTQGPAVIVTINYPLGLLSGSSGLGQRRSSSRQLQ
jgi:para-nitrobenzyl esterase